MQDLWYDCQRKSNGWEGDIARLCCDLAGCQCRRQFAQNALAAGGLRGPRIAERPDLCPEREHRFLVAPERAEARRDTEDDDRCANSIAGDRGRPQRFRNGKNGRRQSLPETKGRRSRKIARDVLGKSTIKTGAGKTRRARRKAR